MTRESDERTRWPPAWAIVPVVTAMLLVGTLAAGAAIPGSGSGSPGASQQTTGDPGGFSGSTAAGDAETRFAGEGPNGTAGWSVASVGDVNGDGVDDVLIGAPRINTSDGNQSGAAYLFFGPVGSGDVNLSEADVTLTGVNETDWAGWSVAGAGDVDGDGVDDVLVSAPLNDDNGEQAGAVYVVHGGSWLGGTTSLAEANATLYGGEYDRAGWSLSNGSRADAREPSVLIGALTDSQGGQDAGAAFLIDASSVGERTFLQNGSDAKFVGEAPGDNAGSAVSWAGDVDDDGVDDVLIGARRNDANGNDSGAAYLVSGDRNGTVNLTDANVTMRGVAAFDEAGHAVAGAGDLDDDGVADVIVGAPFNDSNGNDSGAAYVVYGSSSLPSTIDLSEANVTLAGAAAGDFAGWSVSSAGSGDVTCDRVDDVLVGAPWTDTAGNESGTAYLVSGDESLPATANLSTEATATFVGASSGDRFGLSIGSAGDQNDDGVDDVLVGAPYNDVAGSDSGAAYLFVGDCPAPPEPTPAPTETPTEAPTDTPTEAPTETPTPPPTEAPATTEAPDTTTEAPITTTVAPPTTTSAPPVTTTEEPPVTTTEAPPATTQRPPVTTTEPQPPATDPVPPVTEPPETTEEPATPDDVNAALQVTFFGCGNVELSGPDDLFPMLVQLVTHNPGTDTTFTGPPLLLDEAQQPGSPGGQLTGILTPEGDFVNPNFDVESGSCAGASADNPAPGQPGDPLAPSEGTDGS